MILNRPHLTKRDRRRVMIGLALTFIGGYLFFNFQGMLNGALKSQLIVKEGNDFTVAWNKSPFPISFDVFVFNLTNPVEFAQGGKAKMQELGPYSYEYVLISQIR